LKRKLYPDGKRDKNAHEVTIDTLCNSDSTAQKKQRLAAEPVFPTLMDWSNPIPNSLQRYNNFQYMFFGTPQ
jgi:hypothetical protein